MRQRVALARLMANEPAVLLMDEPLAALDAQTRIILQEELLRIWGQDRPSAERRTVVFITHAIDEAVFLADRVAVFSARPGTIREIIAIEEPHPRKPAFMTSEKFTNLSNQLYSLLHDEIRKAVIESAVSERIGAGKITGGSPS